MTNKAAVQDNESIGSDNIGFGITSNANTHNQRKASNLCKINDVCNYIVTAKKIDSDLKNFEVIGYQC